MEFLHIENLKRYYGSLLALDAKRVELPPGAIGLLGPNGAGKSTLLKILMGLLAPSSGSARVFGLDVAADSLRVRSRVGYVSETDSLVPGLSAVEFVALAGELTGMRRRDAHRRAHEVLAYLGVEESRYRKAETLSAGMRQRVQLAQALVHDPDLLILDEPTNGLDPSGRRAMLELIRSLHRDFGKSVILSSHLLDDVDRVCDSVIILDRGKVLAQSRIDVLRAHLRNRYVIRITGDAQALVDRLEEAGVRARKTSRAGAEDAEFAVELPRAYRLQELFSVLHDMAVHPGGADGAEGVAVLRGLVPQEENLQDIFERIVKSGEVNVAG